MSTTHGQEQFVNSKYFGSNHTVTTALAQSIQAIGKGDIDINSVHLKI